MWKITHSASIQTQRMLAPSYGSSVYICLLNFFMIAVLLHTILYQAFCTSSTSKKSPALLSSFDKNHVIGSIMFLSVNTQQKRNSCFYLFCCHEYYAGEHLGA